jgi:hypothetical protein
VSSTDGAGVSPNPYNYNGMQYYGGADSYPGLPGNSPGGGGGGAVVFEPVTGAGGNGQVWFQALQTLPEGYQVFATPGTWIPPSWTNFIDFVGIGGGGSGEGEILINMGQGGLPGSWNAVTLGAGTDFTPGSTVFTITPGAGGASLVGYFGDGNNGSASTVTWTDPGGHPRTFTCAGGDGGAATGLFSYDGQAPANYTYNNVPYYGGAQALVGCDGNAPGGGGGGAFFFEAITGAGAPGQIWVTARQT